MISSQARQVVRHLIDARAEANSENRKTESVETVFTLSHGLVFFIPASTTKDPSFAQSKQSGS
jgi:hypothetical protein